MKSAPFVAVKTLLILIPGTVYNKFVTKYVPRRGKRRRL